MPSYSYISPLSNLVNTAIKKAANSLNRDFYEIEKLQSSIKDYKEFVVNAYGKVERNLKKELSAVKPDFPFFEEGKPAPQGVHFIVSPLDGLTNFSHGIAHFAVSVAVSDGENIIIGAVYNPATDELFFAEKGKGAYKEGTRSNERLRVSARKDLKGALISSLVNYKKDVSEYSKIHDAIIKSTDNVRVLGAVSLDLAYVASGKLDAAISCNNNFKEIAAGILIAKEAGGHVYGINQKNVRTEDLNDAINGGNLVAVNSNLNKLVYNLINS